MGGRTRPLSIARPSTGWQNYATKKADSPATVSDVHRSFRVECGLRGGKTRDRHAEKRATDVIEPGRLAKTDRGRIAAMIAADAKLDVRPCSAALAHGHLDQRADAYRVQADECIDVDDSLLAIDVEKVSQIVAR